MTTEGYQNSDFMVLMSVVVANEAADKILLLQHYTYDGDEGEWDLPYFLRQKNGDLAAEAMDKLDASTGMGEIQDLVLLSADELEHDVFCVTYRTRAQNEKIKLSEEYANFLWTNPIEAQKLVSSPRSKKDIGVFLESLVRDKQLDEATDALAREQRALADYHNLVRRTQQERTQIAKLASGQLIEDLLEPLEHLSMASEQLADKGLSMVVGKLWQVLEEHGLKEIEALDQEFNLDTMEAVEKNGKGQKVTKVLKRGYTLNGKVIQHAKVIIGSSK